MGCLAGSSEDGRGHHRSRCGPPRCALHAGRLLHWHPGMGRSAQQHSRGPSAGATSIRTAGVFYRRRQGARQTNKRQPPVRLPARLLAHLRRWKRLGIASHAVVEWNGKPVLSVRKSFAAADRPPCHSAHLPTHRGDLGRCSKLRHLGGRRLPRHKPGAFEAGVRPPSS
jgi:hypothetical protein